MGRGYKPEDERSPPPFTGPSHRHQPPFSSSAVFSSRGHGDEPAGVLFPSLGQIPQVSRAFRLNPIGSLGDLREEDPGLALQSFGLDTDQEREGNCRPCQCGHNLHTPGTGGAVWWGPVIVMGSGTGWEKGAKMPGSGRSGLTGRDGEML